VPYVPMASAAASSASAGSAPSIVALAARASARGHDWWESREVTHESMTSHIRMHLFYYRNELAIYLVPLLYVLSIYMGAELCVFMARPLGVCAH